MAWVIVDRQVRPSRLRRNEGRLITMLEDVLDDADKDLTYNTDIGFGSAFQLLSLRFLYVATGVTATRTFYVENINSLGDPINIFESLQSVTASQTKNFEFRIGAPAATYTSTGAGLEPLSPETWLLPGQKFRIRALNADSGDDMRLRVTGRVVD